MNTEISALNLDPNNTNDKSLKFQVQLPNKCPLCSTAYSSKPVFSWFFKNDLGVVYLYAIFFCPSCEDVFFVTYNVNDYWSNDCRYIINQYPAPTALTNLSNSICKLSPKFVEIFHQAEKAENFELTELCGIGYRKALEFLVKDYAISIHPEHKSQIESSQLARCIADFIDNEKIKTLAKASAWLGNDETHYIRKHQNHNIQDLKRFIKATVAYIDSEFSFTEAFEFLNNSQQ